MAIAFYVITTLSCIVFLISVAIFLKPAHASTRDVVGVATLTTSSLLVWAATVSGDWMLASVVSVVPLSRLARWLRLRTGT